MSAGYVYTLCMLSVSKVYRVIIHIGMAFALLVQTMVGNAKVFKERDE